MKKNSQLLASANMLQKLAEGIDPLTGELISDDHLLNNPIIIRHLFFCVNFMSNEIEGKKRKRQRNRTFSITDEQMAAIVLPERKLGVNDFAKAVNVVIDPLISKKLTGTMINKKLKSLGILSEKLTEKGGWRTGTNELSEGYGIETISRVFDGKPYEQIVFNDVGKAFLLNNLKKFFC